MPDPYVNPDRDPPRGQFSKWEPDGLPNNKYPSGDGTISPLFWTALRNERGIFRNDYFISESEKTITVRFVTLSESKLDTKNYYDPINNSFRKLQTVNKNVPATSSALIFTNENFEYWIDLSTISQLSSITLRYAYSIDIEDDDLLSFISSSEVETKDEDIQKIIDFKSQGDATSILDVDFTKYCFIKVKVYRPSDNEETAKDWPSDGSEIQPTGYFYNNFDTSTDFRKVTIKFANRRFQSDYPLISKIKIYNDTNVNLKVAISRIQLFNWGERNLPPQNLPCSAISYAIKISIRALVPTLLNNTFLPTVERPFSIKVFNPDDTINNSGFAHAVNIRFFIITLLDPFSLISGTRFAYVMFVGPTVGKKISSYYLDSKKVSGVSGNIIRLNDVFIFNWTGRIIVQSIESSEQPTNASAWTFLFEYNFNSSNNIELEEISDLTFHHVQGTDKTWYRFIQIDILTSNTQTSEPLKGQLYSERTILQLNTTGESNATPKTLIRNAITISDFDKIKPLAIFSFGTEDDYFTKNIVFKKGIVKFKFSGRSFDPALLFSSHVFLRMWFYAGSLNLNFDLPETTRGPRTELIFQDYVENGVVKTKLQIGTPTSLNDLLVSAPLINDFNEFEIVKFVDGLVDFKNVYAPYPGEDTVRLVVGLYVYSYYNQNIDTIGLKNPPNVEIKIDVNSTNLELPIVKNSTDLLHVSRFYDFNNVARSNFPAFRLVLSNLTFDGDALPKDEYVSYSKKVEQINLSTNPNGFAYSTLLSLRQDFINSEQLKLVLPIPKISLVDDNSISYFVDFVSYFNSFLNTKVNTGKITLNITFDIDLDNTFILNKIKVGVFFVNRTGTITERVFISEFFYLSNEVGTSTVNKEAIINVPFYVSNSDCQIIVRLYYYPFSASGAELSDSEIAEIKQALKGKPSGLRLTDLNISFSDGLFSIYNQLEDRTLGSVNYEDLPLVPQQSLDSQQFWFAAPDEASFLQYLPVDGNANILIVDGAVYSPTWIVTLPEDLEVDRRFSPQIIDEDYPVWFRTVPFDAASSADEKISAIENSNGDKMVHVATNELTSPFEVSSKAVSSNMNLYKSPNPITTPFVSSELPKYIQNKDGITMKGFNPSLTIDVDKGNNLTALTQDTGNDAFNKVATSLNSGNDFQYANSSGDFEQNFLVKYASDLTKTSVVHDKKSKIMYIVGYSTPGSIILKTFYYGNPGSFQGINSNNQAESEIIFYNYLVDGASNPVYDSKQALILPNQLSGISAVETFSGIAIDEQGNVAVAYVLQGEETKIYARMIYSKARTISNSIVVVDMGALTKHKSLKVFCPVLYYFNSTFYLVFWCANKLFFTSFNSLPLNSQSFEFPIKPVFLLAGSQDFESTSNEANPFLKNLISEQKLFIYKQDPNENELDLKIQAAGFFVSQNPKYLGQMFVYYRSASSNIMMRQILQGGFTSSPLKYTN